MACFFYVMRSEVDGSYYRGQSGDLKSRVKKHNDGESQSTKSKRPWRLVYVEEFSTRSEAVRREQYLKSPAGWQDWKKLKQQIEEKTNSERSAAR
ncbi:MAG: GIY-YIG nuclease family protein [Ignavibacteriales bacterium]|nr:GIY-YIG nuclease family protein [Ignavibacteriales bacterium]